MSEPEVRCARCDHPKRDHTIEKSVWDPEGGMGAPTMILTRCFAACDCTEYVPPASKGEVGK